MPDLSTPCRRPPQKRLQLFLAKFWAFLVTNDCLYWPIDWLYWVIKAADTMDNHTQNLLCWHLEQIHSQDKRLTLDLLKIFFLPISGLNDHLWLIGLLQMGLWGTPIGGREYQKHGCMARGGLGLPELLLGPAMPNPSTPCGRPPLKRPYSCFRDGMMSCHDVMLSWHVVMPFCHVMLSCNVIMPCHHVDITCQHNMSTPCRHNMLT
jgi:hypothetical protein